ncbi:MAG: hypothetical protein VKL42_02640, partial [Snowella sp.]|nr:hypothetical protein [Snowella sp.]
MVSFSALRLFQSEVEEDFFCNRSGGNQENAPHGIGRNHDEKVVVIDFIAIILSSKSPMSS